MIGMKSTGIIRKVDELGRIVLPEFQIPQPEEPISVLKNPLISGRSPAAV